jgi:hypothetical protein
MCSLSLLVLLVRRGGLAGAWLDGVEHGGVMLLEFLERV